MLQTRPATIEDAQRISALLTANGSDQGGALYGDWSLGVVTNYITNGAPVIVATEQRWFREDLERLAERGVSFWDGRTPLVLNNASEAEFEQFLEVFTETGDESVVVCLADVRQAAQCLSHRSNYDG